MIDVFHSTIGGSLFHCTYYQVQLTFYGRMIMEQARVSPHLYSWQNFYDISGICLFSFARPDNSYRVFAPAGRHIHRKAAFNIITPYILDYLREQAFFIPTPLTTIVSWFYPNKVPTKCQKNANFRPSALSFWYALLFLQLTRQQYLIWQISIPVCSQKLRFL